MSPAPHSIHGSRRRLRHLRQRPANRPDGYSPSSGGRRIGTSTTAVRCSTPLPSTIAAASGTTISHLSPDDDVRSPLETVRPTGQSVVMFDFDHCYRIVSSRDSRFDGWFFTAVTTTGIYCLPSCPAMTPKRSNVRFYPSAAAAQGGGFRACRRCRPDASPGSPEWNVRADAVARAMRLISDGVVDRDGVAGLAERLGYSERHLHRLLVAEVGAGVQALARAQRAQTARTLLETTDLPVTQVAFASGFASVRQFNDTVRDVFATTPTGLRDRRRNRDGVEPGRVELRLAYREPCDVATTLAFLGLRAVPGVEEYDGVTYRRSLSLAHGQAVVALTPADGHVR